MHAVQDVSPEVVHADRQPCCRPLPLSPSPPSQQSHSRKPPVIHGDLRSPNLLLDLTIDKERPRFHVKIADFGLARMLGAQGEKHIMVSKTTNPRWLAPEVIKHSAIGKAAE